MTTKKKERKPKYNQTEVIKALYASGGMISVAARALGCSANTIRSYSEKYPAVAEAIQHEREAFVDEATTALRDQVAQGNTAAIIFALKTLGKSRGFIEKQQVEHSGDMAAVVNISMEPPSTTYEIDDPKSTTDT